MYFPTVIADLWVSIFLLNFLCYAGKWYTCSFNGSHPEKYASALKESLFTDEEIASSCYCVMKWSTKTPLPMEKKGVFKMHVVTLLHYKSLTWLSSLEREHMVPCHRGSI